MVRADPGRIAAPAEPAPDPAPPMAKPRARKRFDSRTDSLAGPGGAYDDAPERHDEADLLDLALAHGFDDEDAESQDAPGELVLTADLPDGLGPEALLDGSRDTDAEKQTEDAGKPEAQACLPEVPDLAGGLVAEMQNRFAELQKWADTSTTDLQERRRKITAAEAELKRRGEEAEADRQKTAHDRERFARYRAAETQKLADQAKQTAAEAVDAIASAEDDARILRETAAAEAAEAAEATRAEAQRQIEAQRRAAEERTAEHRRGVEADLAKRGDAIAAEAAALAREQQRLEEARTRWPPCGRNSTPSGRASCGCNAAPRRW